MTIHPLIVEQHPVVALLILWAVVWAVVLGIAPRGFAAPLWSSAVTTRALPATLIAGFIASMVWYGCKATYFDAAEPTITAVAAMFKAGRPLYPGLDAPERYVHVYGPMLFMAHALFLSAFGASIGASKAVGVTAALGALALAFWTFVRRAGHARALLALGYCVLFYATAADVAFWSRPDSLLIAAVSLALASTEFRNQPFAIGVFGLALGIAVNLKITGPVYMLPIALIVWQQRGTTALLGALAVAAVVTIAPFTLPTISLDHYVSYLRRSAANGLMLSRLRLNLEWVVFLVVPLVMLVRGPRTSRRADALSAPGQFIPMSVAAMCVIAFAGAKPGGGAYHLLPFAPLLAYAGSTAAPRRSRSIDALAIATVIVFAAIAIPRQHRFIDAIQRRPIDAQLVEVRQFATEHPDQSVGMGFAGAPLLSQAGVALALAGQDFWLDGPATQEDRIAGAPLPPATLDAIDSCRTWFWLLPAGPPPFAVVSAYAPMAPTDVFPPEFQAAFLRRYVRSGSTGSFDVWECRR